MIFADCHTHSYLSFDGSVDATPDLMCQKAISLGLTDIAITDHADMNAGVMGYEIPDDDRMEKEILACKERYRGQLHVGYGIELGEPCEEPEAARALLEKHDFDFVLGSLHNLEGCVDFAYINFSDPDFGEKLTDHLFSRMLSETDRLADFPGIHSIAHLTYMERYLMKAGKKPVNKAPFEERLRLFFKKLTEKQIALELNVSPISRGSGRFTMPDADLMRMYKEAGGELVTVGSDAHCPEHIGKGIKEGYRLLSDCGFRYVTVYRDGKARQFPI